jgi:YaiO family outer membrane protein
MTYKFQGFRLPFAAVLVAFAAMRAPCQVITTPAPEQTPALTAVANAPVAPEKQTLNNYLEIGSSYFSLSDRFGPWNGGYARSLVTNGDDTFNGEIAGQHEFGDSGTYFAVGDTHTFSSNSFASLTLGSSAGGFFLPRFRGDAFVSRKWMSRKQLITTAGFGYYQAKDPHRDHSFFIGTTYYFEKPWILENGVRFNVSHPGNVFSPAGFLAITQGKNKQHYIVVRLGYGEEAYQLIGPTSLLSDFRSQTATVTWRKWITQNWGINWVADYYGNPYYTRVGTTLGVFKEF